MIEQLSSEKLLDAALSSIECRLPPGSTVVVGLSGGVDSSVSLALMKELGYNVIGLFMKNWEESGDACPVEADFRDVALVANTLNVPYFPVNFTKQYREEVFEKFLDGLRAGRTPNPDILCNLEIKFKHLLNAALSLGSSALATGHYARCTVEQDVFSLQKAYDDSKDQSYFLHTASQKTLPHTIFPLGKLKKKEVRQLAHLFRLPVAEKKDSTGICFIGKRNFASFISQYIGYTPGIMRNPEGHVVGEHVGLAYYTIGQRKGLMIGGPGDAWFVVGKRIENNELIVAQGENHPALFSQGLMLNSVHWIHGSEPLFPLSCSAKIRYRQPDQPCIVEKISFHGGAHQYRVTFREPQRAITPEQSCVFYLGNTCLGGGSIT